MDPLYVLISPLFSIPSDARGVDEIKRRHMPRARMESLLVLPTGCPRLGKASFFHAQGLSYVTVLAARPPAQFSSVHLEKPKPVLTQCLLDPLHQCQDLFFLKPPTDDLHAHG